MIYNILLYVGMFLIAFGFALSLYSKYKIREIEKESQNLNLENLGGICFNSDIYSIKHENLKTRIYKT